MIIMWFAYAQHIKRKLYLIYRNKHIELNITWTIIFHNVEILWIIKIWKISMCSIYIQFVFITNSFERQRMFNINTICFDFVYVVLKQNYKINVVDSSKYLIKMFNKMLWFFVAVVTAFNERNLLKFNVC